MSQRLKCTLDGVIRGASDFLLHDDAHDLINTMSGAKRKSYTGSKLLHPLKILGTRAGSEYGISENISLQIVLDCSNVFALPCSVALSSDILRCNLCSGKYSIAKMIYKYIFDA